MSRLAGQEEREAERRILRERARRLARVPAADAGNEGALEVVRFRLGEHLYAIEAHYVFSTRWLHELTPVPGTPPAFLGITPHQGGVLPVVALDVLFGHAASGVRDLHRVLVVGDSWPEVGLAAGKDVEVAWIGEAELLPAVEGAEGGSGRLVAGMTEAGLTMLDGTALLDDERMFHRSPRARDASRAAADGGQ